MNIDIVKRFICGAKEAYKKVDNHSFNFPITIESAYRLATNIEKLLKEQEAKQVETEEINDGRLYRPVMSHGDDVTKTAVLPLLREGSEME